MSIPCFPSVPGQLFIGGEWREPNDGQRFPVHDPATGDPITAVGNATSADGLVAIDAASTAAPGLASMAPRERADVLRAAFELMTEDADLIAELIVRENGKTLRDALGEVRYAAEFFRWYGEEAVRIDGRLLRSPAGGNNIAVLTQPVGVAVLVTPWNFPAAMATRKIGPAIAAGCPVILKPAAETPLTALVIADILSRAGAPPGSVNVLPTRDASQLVTPMLSDGRVRKLSFTGSTAVGSLLLEQAAGSILNCSLELGGNAPFVVFEDADLEAAIEGALVAKLRNGGASCIAANRFLVHESIAGSFAASLAEAMGTLRVGPGLADGTELGPLISQSECSKLAQTVEVGVSAGARVLSAGETPDGGGFYFPPTVLGKVEQDNPLLSEELFGPVAPIVSFTEADEAVAMANDTPYGLAGYVYTENLSLGLSTAEALEVGMVGINRGFISDSAAPFGGVKHSGLGREGGREGVKEFCETKYVAVDW